MGWVCQAVRAPGAKCALAALSREAGEGVASVSKQTVPVNHSLGPAAVSRLLLVICMVVLLMNGIRPSVIVYRPVLFSSSSG